MKALNTTEKIILDAMLAVSKAPTPFKLKKISKIVNNNLKLVMFFWSLRMVIILSKYFLQRALTYSALSTRIIS